MRLVVLAVLIAVGIAIGGLAAQPEAPASIVSAPHKAAVVAASETGQLWPTLGDEDPKVSHSRTQLLWGLAATVWRWVVLAAILFSGLSPRLCQLAADVTGKRLGKVAPYVVLLTVVTAALSLPLDCYRGFVLEHAFGLSNQTWWSWLLDTGKGVGLSVVVSLGIVVPAYALMRRFPNRWWLYVAALAIVLAVIGTALYPLVVTPLFNDVQPLQDESLKTQILQLADKAGLAVADVVQVDLSRQTRAANAYFAGMGPAQRIIVSDTLLANFSEEEILAVVGHEMGHQVHNDLWRGLAATSVLTLVAAYLVHRGACTLARRFGPRFGFRDLSDAASLPLLVLLVAVVSFVGQPATNTFSRHLEHQADAYTLELTRLNTAYASALTKFGEINLSDPNPPEIVELLFYTHPSLAKRIEFARSYHTSE